MSDSRSSRRTGRPGKVKLGPASVTSVPRTGAALLLVLLGIAWVTVYVLVAGPRATGSR